MIIIYDENNKKKKKIFCFITNQKKEKNIIERFKRYCKKNEKLEYFTNWKSWNISIEDPLIDLKEEKKKCETAIYDEDDPSLELNDENDIMLIINECVQQVISEEGIDIVRGGCYLNTNLDELEFSSLLCAEICIKHKVGIKYCRCTFSKNIVDGSTIIDPYIYDFCSCCNEPFYNSDDLRNHERTCY